MTMRLSTAALETLSIIAYKQPLTRAEIEEIRGVEVIAALETLLEKGLVRVVGRKETVGRPLLYGTTPEFLRQFGLRSISDLPPLDAFQPPPAPPSASGDEREEHGLRTPPPAPQSASPAQAPAGPAGETDTVVENAPPDKPQA
jgi:segregation and condensation protein B